MNDLIASNGILNINENRYLAPDYAFSDVPEGIKIPEIERMELISQYISKLIEKIPVRDKQLIEFLWPKVLHWNANINIHPYRKEH